MIREKTIVLSACLVISVVIFEAASMLSRDYSPSMKEVVQDNNPMDNASNVGEKNDTQPYPFKALDGVMTYFMIEAISTIVGSN